MTLARFPDWPVQDELGNLVEDVSVEVRREDNLAALAVIKSDRAGATPLANPYVAADGIVGFHALGGAYRIRAYKTIGAETFERIRRYVPIGTAGETDTELGLSGGMLLTFDTGTTDADPGAGTIRFNHATPASATFAYASLEDIYETDITAWLESLDDGSSSTDKGRIRLQVAGNPAAWFTFRVTGAVVTATGYRKIPLAIIASSGATLVDGDTLSVFDGPGMAGAAADISYAGGSGMSATTVEGAIDELATEKFDKTDIDTDVALTANSDTKVASQKATKAYVDSIVAANDAMVFKGVIDCSANPNYPAADRGWTYRVSVAGKIGGASGPNVQVGDVLICLTDGTVTGNHATVGASWSIIQANIDGALLTTDIGVTVQGYDADLAAVAALASNGLISRTGSGTVAARTITGTANELTVTNGDGVSGNPTLSIPAAVTLTGKTITGGTFSGPSLSGTVALASGAVLNWNVGDITLTHSADTLTLAGGVWVVPSAGLQVGSSVPFSDAAGVLTLQNVDALDATTEATIEAAIDTLGNLTSIQGHTFTLTGSLIRSGAHALTITTTGTTGVTLPTTGTLATLAGTEALTGKTISGASNTLSNIPQSALTGLGTADSPQFGGLNVGHASDSLIDRLAAGVIRVAGKIIAAPTITAGDANKPVVLNAAETGYEFANMGTFTPTLSFGGASVGMTASVAAGRYFRLGKTVFYQVNMTLTAKGSSTGVAVIAGLPLMPVASFAGAAMFLATNMTSGVGDTQLSVSTANSGIRAYKQASGLISQLTDADFTNTSVFIISGHYFME